MYVTQSSPSKKDSRVRLGSLTKMALLDTKDSETARGWGAHQSAQARLPDQQAQGLCLPLHPHCWSYREARPCPPSSMWMLEIEPGPQACTVSKSVTESSLQLLNFHFSLLSLLPSPSLLPLLFLFFSSLLSWFWK